MPNPSDDGRGRHVPLGGRRLWIREWGGPAGDAVLLLHGAPTSGLLWRDVAPRLASRARVIAPDLLGYGRSDRPGGYPVDLPSQAGYVRRLMDALGIARATAVGHDIGGGVAQILAVTDPERVERLGLVNSVSHDAWPIPEMKAARRLAPLVARMPGGPAARAIALYLRRGFEDGRRADFFLHRFLEPFSTPGGMEAFAEHARAMDSDATMEIAPLLRHLAVPAAVIWGGRDPFLSSESARRLAAEMPGAELTWIESASHFAPADAPGPVADALLRLLARSTGSG